MLAPLPRAYEEGQNGAVPCSDEARLIGQGVQVDGISKAAQDLKTRLEEEVIKPLRAWLMVYKTVSVSRSLTPASSYGDSYVGSGAYTPVALRPPKHWTPSQWSEVCRPQTHHPCCPPPMQERMTKLEALRLEVDSRRRTVDALGCKLTNAAGCVPSPRGEFPSTRSALVMVRCRLCQVVL